MRAGEMGFSPPRTYGEGSGVGLFGAGDARFRGFRNRRAPHPLPPPRKNGEGNLRCAILAPG
jgi:hypothetical protein